MENAFKSLLTFNEAVAEMFKCDEDDFKKFEEELASDSNEDLSELLNNPLLQSILGDVDDSKLMEMLDGLKNLGGQQ